jgi:surface protein
MFIGCTSLVSVDVSNFNLKESAYINPEGLFANSPMLKIIKANNCNLYTLNLILRGLPTVIGGKGIVYKLNDNAWCDKINTVTIESKNWKVCLRPGYHKKNITIGERYL